MGEFHSAAQAGSYKVEHNRELYGLEKEEHEAHGAIESSSFVNLAIPKHPTDGDPNHHDQGRHAE
jgi:hypothetical protein